METRTATSGISREKFVSFISGLADRYPNPEGDPQPPGPWDPYIRQAFAKVFGPFPEPWRNRFESADERLRNLANIKPEVWDVIGSGSWEKVALNPQPLPPRWAIGLEFVRGAADRLVAIQEIADTINNGSDRAIIVVGGKISELVDFVCGTAFGKKIPPPPPPDPRQDPLLTGSELIVMGAELLSCAKGVSNKKLADEFSRAGERLMDEGLERL
jgi:hypothetical protein